MNSPTIITMPSKPKTLRRKHLIEIILVILALYNFGKFFGQISNYVNMPKVTIAHIIY